MQTPDEIRDWCKCPKCGKEHIHSEVSHAYYEENAEKWKCPDCGTTSDISDSYHWNGEDSVHYFILKEEGKDE